MKILKTIVVLCAFCIATKVDAQRYQKDKKLKETETITKELNFNRNSSDNILVVDNVYGSIDVQGYSGNTIQVEVVKTVSADTKDELQKGKEEIGIKTAKKDDAVYVYMNSPYTKFDIETGNYEHHEFNFSSRRSYKHRKKRMYKYRLDFKIKVPKNTSIDVKAVNNGNIKIVDVQGKLLIVKNINGAIDMKNVSGITDVNALNKDITITYAENPEEESFYNSLNGDITVKFQDNLNASISYKTMNGGFYTNFDVSKTTPQFKSTKEYSKKGTKFKINSNKQFKIGNGKVHLHFNQLNGDAIVKKI
ncbi:hypothetical protein [Polaribacter porphyrae]|uniref:Adhesin domain-containing protein n=1 Tax=Polaribacter porphyrae TaxID=1137780 RepID=A0A2S7WNA2_9FLAO|nr:hypothetical protein [Polaribacter porphyrae]PQJ79080.1 hypothetical protein BTO18_07795 [Polaribacter porphyrae]